MKNDDIIKIINTARRDGWMDLRWRVTSVCNYQCDFCIQGDRETHARLAAGESGEIRTAVCRRLRGIIDGLSEYRGVNIELVGGEIGIIREMPEIVGTLAGSDFDGPVMMHITTNFSAPAEFYAELTRIARRYDRRRAERRLNITASYYAAYVSREAFSEKIREYLRLAGCKSGGSAAGALAGKVGRLLGRRPAPALDVVYPVLTDGDYEDFLEMQASLLKEPVHCRPLWIREHPVQVSETVKEKVLKKPAGGGAIRVTDREGRVTDYRDIQALGACLEDAERFCPKGCICDAGVHSVWVNAFGEAYRCPAIGSDMSMGSILDESFCFMEKPGICTNGHCSCNAFGVIRRAGP